MKTLTFTYPGDPPTVCRQMNRREFLAKHPRRPTQILTGDSLLNLTVVEEIPVPPNAIYCDACGEDPVDDIYVVDSSRAYCRACAEMYVLPYCKENEA